MTIIIETAPNIKFTNKKKEFEKGGYRGYISKRKHGILFMNAEKEPMAYMTRNDGGFFVTVRAVEIDGRKRIFYMYGLGSYSERFLGFREDMSWLEGRKIAHAIIAKHYS